MADGTIGVAQATSPDRQLDNVVVLNDASTSVYRQKVDINGSLLEQLLMEIRVLVANISGSYPDPAGRTRVSLDATGLGATVNITTVATVSTVTSVTAMTNLLQEGGQPANTNVGSLLNMGADIGQRACIVVS